MWATPHQRKNQRKRERERERERKEIGAAAGVSTPSFTLFGTHSTLYYYHLFFIYLFLVRGGALLVVVLLPHPRGRPCFFIFLIDFFLFDKITDSKLNENDSSKFRHINLMNSENWPPPKKEHNSKWSPKHGNTGSVRSPIRAKM